MVFFHFRYEIITLSFFRYLYYNRLDNKYIENALPEVYLDFYWTLTFIVLRRGSCQEF